MRFRVIAIMVFVITALILASAAQSTDYTGKAKVVLQLTKMPDMPAMPQNEAADSAGTYGLTAAAVATPEVPQGSTVQGEVLYSADPAVKAGQAYTLYINYNPKNKPAGFQSGLIDKLKSGAVVGVNDYTVSGNMLTVNIGSSADWSRKISILDMQYTDPGETKNPFMIDLGGFRQFDAFPAFNTTPLKPMNMSEWGWSNDLLGGTSGSLTFSELFDKIGHVFD